MVIVFHHEGAFGAAVVLHQSRVFTTIQEPKSWFKGFSGRFSGFRCRPIGGIGGCL